MDNPFLSPSVLCIGPGILGLERGAERAIGEIRPIAYVEIEAFIVANLLAGMQAGMVAEAPIWTDAKTFPAKPFRKKIHGLMAGYPCQPFSLAGNREGENDPRHIYPFISGIIETTGPVWCLFENVSGHASMGFDQVYKDLRRMGYAVEAGIFTAEEVGAPHERERLFILAISERFIRYTRRKRIRWETWTNINWSCQGSELGNARLFRPEGPEQPTTGFEEYGRQLDDTKSIEGGLFVPERRSGKSDIEFIRPGEAVGNSNGNVYPGGLASGCDTENKGGIESEGNQRERLWIQSGTAGKNELGHTEHRRCEQCNEGFIKLQFTDQGCEQLSDAEQQRLEGQRTNAGKSPQSQDWDCGIELPDSDSTNDERSGIFGQTSRITQPGYLHQWPAGPGQQQYDWEEKRTVESGMGSAIDGYNFREDLLRAYGNSVVEQTAELAFVTLLKKHIKNIDLQK